MRAILARYENNDNNIIVGAIKRGRNHETTNALNAMFLSGPSVKSQERISEGESGKEGSMKEGSMKEGSADQLPPTEGESAPTVEGEGPPANEDEPLAAPAVEGEEQPGEAPTEPTEAPTEPATEEQAPTEEEPSAPETEAPTEEPVATEEWEQRHVCVTWVVSLAAPSTC